MSGTEHSEEKKVNRREMLSTVCMAGAMAASFGALGRVGVKYLTPRRADAASRELFIGKAGDIPVNSSTIVMDLEGREVIVLRTKEGFKGFSNVCPHLGCHVLWRSEENDFFCPCHLGQFDAEGKAIAGPPFKAAQVLAKVEIKHDVASDNLFLVSKA